MLQILGYLATLANPLRLLSLGSFKDVELPVRVDNCRCSHGLGMDWNNFATIYRRNSIQLSMEKY